MEFINIDLQVTKAKSYLDTCLKEACESIQRCLALLGGDAGSEDVEQKAQRENVLNQLLLLLNTAINRQQQDSRSGSFLLGLPPPQVQFCPGEEEEGEGREEGGPASSEHRRHGLHNVCDCCDICTPQDDGEEGSTNYMSGALGLIPST